MLLRAGVLSMAVAICLAVAAVLFVVVGGKDEPVDLGSSAEMVAETDAPVPPRAPPEEPGEPREQPQEKSRADEPRERSERVAPRREPAPVPMTEEGWDRPTRAELAAAKEPRRYAPDPGVPLTLTVPKLQVYGAPVFDSDSAEALYAGVAHVPETSMPWDRGEQRNVYLAAHRIGYYGSGSRMLFYHLDALASGDEVILEGRGKTYRYRVTEKLVVAPTESWVMGQVVGKDMLSLQTCTPIPTFEMRLVVRAERV